MSKRVRIGKIYVGGGERVAVQTMCDVKTSFTDRVIEEINSVTALGCDIVRVSVKDEADALAIKTIKAATDIPLVADIHFDYRLALKAMDQGVDKIRINPGNIGSDDKVEAVAKALKENDVAVRVGSNTGSVEKEFLAKYGSLGEDFEVDYLFVSHHGSKYSSTTNFLQKIKPKVAIVSCGQSGYPARQVVERLNDVGVEKIYKTSESGTIICAQGESGTTSITEISFSLDSAFIVVVLGICMLVVCKILNENKYNSKFVSIKIEK